MHTHFRPRSSLVLSGLLLMFLLFKAAWVEPHTTWFRLNSPAGVALPAQHRTHVEFGQAVALLGYDLDTQTVEQGGAWRIRLYWQALKPLGQDYASFVHLLAGPDQHTFAHTEAQHPGNIPTRTWRTTEYVVDEHWLSLSSDLPAVAYQIRVGLFQPETGQQLGETELPLTVYVNPQQPILPSDVPTPELTQFGEGIWLLGYQLVGGGSAHLTLFWQVSAQPRHSYQAFVHLLDEKGQLIGQADGTPVNGLYPTSLWLPGEIIQDAYAIHIPAKRRPAALQVGLYDLATGARLTAQRVRGAQPAPSSAVQRSRQPGLGASKVLQGALALYHLELILGWSHLPAPNVPASQLQPWQDNAVRIPWATP